MEPERNSPDDEPDLGANANSDAGAADPRAADDEDQTSAGDAALVAEAQAEAEALSDDEGQVLGVPGPPLSRRSPFMIGLLAAAGVGVTYEIFQFLLAAAGVIVLIGLSLFLAIGLEPAVQRLMSWHIKRGLSVLIVALLFLGIVGGFLAAAIPPLVSQTQAFIHQIPHYAQEMRDHSGTLGRLDARFHIQDNITKAVKSTNGGAVANGVIGAGRVVLTATASTLTVLVLTVYLLADLPRIRRLVYRLAPVSRRARIILIGDEISAKVGRYVLGNVLTSLIAGVGTLIWLLAFGVPYPIVLAILVAVFDLIPVVGSTVAGIIVTLVALTVSFPVALATAAFYIAYRLLEDYLIVPRVIGHAVAVPATVTIVAVLIGGAVMGLIGALVAIPVAAAIDILLRETVFPRLDKV